MPNAILLYLGDTQRVKPELLTSPWPGDPWQVEPLPDTVAALKRLGGKMADVLLIDGQTVQQSAADLERLRSEAGARGVSIVLLGPAPPDGPFASAVSIPFPADGRGRHALAHVIEQARIDRQLRQFRELGDNEFVTEMIDLLTQQTPEQIEAMRTALAGASLRNVQRAAHSLKSSAGNFGARIVEELAFQIERAAAEGNAAPLAELVEHLHEAYERARFYLMQKRG